MHSRHSRVKWCGNDRERTGMPSGPVGSLIAMDPYMAWDPVESYGSSLTKYGLGEVVDSGDEACVGRWDHNVESLKG